MVGPSKFWRVLERRLEAGSFLLNVEATPPLISG